MENEYLHNRAMRKRVAIVQEYVPEYRRAFFERLRAELDAIGIDLTIGVGCPSEKQRDRGDEADLPEGFVRVPSRTLAVAGRAVTSRRVGSATRGADLVIVEQALRHLDTYGLVIRQAVGGASVALWGHGGTYVDHPRNPAEEWVKAWLTRRAKWFFAYTAGGADAVVERGFPRDRVVVVQNSIDVDELRQMRSAVTDAQANAVRAKLRLPGSATCLFVGALDSSKRLDFLFAAARRIALELPEFTLVVAGDGPDRKQVEETVRREPWLRYVGRASARDKAQLASVSRLMLMPGRVGLVAVDSLALETPIVTTTWPWHAPEFEYLRPARNAVVVDDDVEVFANAVSSSLRDPDLVRQLSSGCRTDAPLYSLDVMVSNFATGVRSALRSDR